MFFCGEAKFQTVTNTHFQKQGNTDDVKLMLKVEDFLAGNLYMSCKRFKWSSKKDQKSLEDSKSSCVLLLLHFSVIQL